MAGPPTDIRCRVIMKKELMPPVDTELTKNERDVVRILREVPKLVLDAVARRLPRFLRWGTRSRRSALDDDNSLPPPPPPAPTSSPPPPAPTSPPPDGNDERNDGSRGDGATSNPETSLFFPACGGEEPDSRPPRPLSSSVKALKNPKHVKAFKNTKRHKEVNLFLRWGTRARRGRSALGDGATSSPETPLSFPARGGEEPDSRSPRPLSSSVKALKNPKRVKAFKNTINFFLRWGTRSRRSALVDDNSLLSLPPPPPPALTSPPPDGNDERKDGRRGRGGWRY